MPACEKVLLLGFGEAREPLAKRLRLLNFEPVGAETEAEARRARERHGEALRAALVAVRPADASLAPRARVVAGRATEGLRLVAVGPPPEDAERETLREAGVHRALWEPFNDGELRFVVNEAVRSPEDADRREHPRVPSSVLARVVSASGSKSAFVYSLSREGAFLETHRPTSPRGRVRVELPLPERSVVAEARVVQTNVPGNLQRGNLPMGMGVRFEALGTEDRAALERYVAERAGALRV